MNKIIKYLMYLFLIIGSATSSAATLQPGDVLIFSATNSFVEGTWGYNGPGTGFYDIAYVDAQNGLIIGSAQPTIPGIDQTWSSVYNGAQGNHRTTSPVSVINETTLDFSGWIMTMFGTEDYAFGSQQGMANYTYDGNTYTLDYYWDYSDNASVALGSLLVKDYHLHLTGTVVPVPAAVWLFSSGLLGLIGISRRKKTA